MKRNRQGRAALLIGVAVSIAMALAGCDVAAVRPAATPGSTPAPTTAAAATSPQPGLRLPCASILASADLAARLTDPITVQRDESTRPRGVGDAAFAQAGGLRCVWGGEDMTDDGYDVGLDLEILPDTAGQYTGQANDPAENSCLMDSGAGRCVRSTHTGSYWIAATMSGIVASTTAEASRVADEVVATVVAKANGDGAPRAEWTPPHGSGGHVGACTGDERDRVAAAVPTAADELVSSTVDAGPLTVQSAAAQRVGVVSCVWTLRDAPAGGPTPYGVSVEELPGGSWAFDAGAENPRPPYYGVPSLTRATVAGADTLIWCGQTCIGQFAVGHDYVSYSQDAMDPAAFSPSLERYIRSGG